MQAAPNCFLDVFIVRLITFPDMIAGPLYILR
jgi:hypothetical protein